MTTDIRKHVTEMTNVFKAIETFLQTNYILKKRCTGSELLKATGIKQADILFYLNNWLDHIPLNTPAAEIVNKLCIFYSENHERPGYFEGLHLTTEQRRAIHQHSRQMHFAGYAFIKMFKGAYLHVQGNEAIVQNTMQLANTAVHESLHNWINGSEHKGEVEPLIFETNHFELWSSRDSQVIRKNYESVSTQFQWGRIDFNHFDKLCQDNNKDLDILCLLDKNEDGYGKVARETRKGICEKLSGFRDSMISNGFIFTDLRMCAMTTATKPRLAFGRFPQLRFIHPSEPMVEVIIDFHKFVNTGKYILN